MITKKSIADFIETVKEMWREAEDVDDTPYKSSFTTQLSGTEELNLEVEKAKLTSAARNNLPDSAFAFIESGGSKDEGGKTTPRSLRHFPIHDAAHVRNALARIGQGAKFGKQALSKVTAAAKKFGIKIKKADEDYDDVLKAFHLFDENTGHMKDFEETFEEIIEIRTDEKTTSTEGQKTTTGSRESKTTFSRDIMIKSVDKREWIVYGVVMEPTAEGSISSSGHFEGSVSSVDAHGHFTTAPEIRKAMIGFMEELNKTKGDPHNVQHNKNVIPRTAIIENFQAPTDFELGGELVVKDSWVMGVKIYDPPLREAIEKGETTGFSIEGKGALLEVPTAA